MILSVCHVCEIPHHSYHYNIFVTVKDHY